MESKAEFGRMGFVFEFKDGTRQFSWSDELDFWSEPVVYVSATAVYEKVRIKRDSKS